MALYSEKERTAPLSRQVRFARPGPSLHEIVVLVTLKAKRERVLEVKMRRIAAELEAVTGHRPTPVQVGGGGSAVFGTRSWIAPDILVRLLRARLEQASPNSAMFHFSEFGEASDSIIAMEATGVARM
jgi:hypothetical protein